MRRPDILFIVVDDCGYADLGCTGQTSYRTPALDRLANEAAALRGQPARDAAPAAVPVKPGSS